MAVLKGYEREAIYIQRGEWGISGTGIRDLILPLTSVGASTAPYRNTTHLSRYKFTRARKQ